LLTQAGAFLGIELVRIFALAAASESRGASGVVTILILQVIGQRRLGGESIDVELGCGRIVTNGEQLGGTSSMTTGIALPGVDQPCYNRRSHVCKGRFG
jgi:hypothetical protein